MRAFLASNLMVLSSLANVLVAAGLMEPTAEAVPEKQPSVYVRSVRQQALFELLLYPVRVEPKINAMVLADIDGVVMSIATPLGSKVRARQTLLTLRNVDPAYHYEPLSVVTPIAGVVGHVDVSVGSRVSRGDKLLSVTDPAQVRFIVEVAASDLSMVKEGLLGELRIPETADPLVLRVKGVSPFVDPATGTAICELELASVSTKQNVLAPGAIGRVSFKANEHRGFTVADSAVTYRGKDPFVRVVNGRVSRHVAVILGRKQEGQVEVLRGLKEGDDVVERASGFVADGETVVVERAGEETKPLNSDAPASAGS